MNGTEANAHHEPGWLDVGEYLKHLRSTTGRSWCVCVAVTGEHTPETVLLFSVCEYYAGAPVVRDDLALTAASWPSYHRRGVASTVHELLYRFDRRLEEREMGAVVQAAF